MPILLAHGALGSYDELLFIGVAVIFLVMMGISWVRSRNLPPPVDDAGTPVAPADSDTPNHVSLD